MSKRTYELIYVLKPDAPESEVADIVERLGGTIDKTENGMPWGRRKLAYEIQHKGEANYHVFQFDADAETLAEITRVLKITDGALRHMAVRRPVVRARREAVTPTG